jgi:hypothetical protein
LWILWKFYLVPRIIKSRSQCPNYAIFVENVTILPGTVVVVERMLCLIDEHLSQPKEVKTA